MNKKRVLTGMYAVIFWASFGYIIYGTLISAFIAEYDMTLRQAGWIGSVLCVGQLMIQFLCNSLSKRYTRLQLVLIGTVMSIAAFLLIIAARIYWVLLLAFLIDGASISLLNVVICAYISDEFPEKRSAYLNLFHGFYGIGSMTGPVLPTVLLANKISWKYGYAGVVLAGIFIVVFLLGLKGNFEKGKKSNPKAESFILLLRNPRLLCVCFCTMLCVGFDTVIATYMAAYFETQLGAAAIAGLALSFYWGGSAAGRLLYPLLFERFHPKKFLTTVNAGTALLLIIGLLSSRASVMFAVITLTGMFSGMNYPMEIGFACEVYPDNSISATNAACFFASIGGIIFPLAAGWLLESGGCSWLIIQCAAMVSGIALFLLIVMKLERKEIQYV